VERATGEHEKGDTKKVDKDGKPNIEEKRKTSKIRKPPRKRESQREEEN